MDFETVLATILKDPAFQKIIQSIIADLFAKISGGASPIAAVQQGAAQAAAAATFHLTGNPLADFGALVANLQPHAASATPSVAGLPPAPPGTPGFLFPPATAGTFTS